MRSTTYDPAGTVADGIAAFERAVAAGHGADPARRYRLLAGGIRSAMRPGDTCVLAFAADLERRDGARTPAPAFVAVLDDRVLIAWRRSRLRSGADTMVVRRASISAVRTRTGVIGPEHVLLSRTDDRDIEFAAPAGTRAVLDEVLCRTPRSTTAAARPVGRPC